VPVAVKLPKRSQKLCGSMEAMVVTKGVLSSSLMRKQAFFQQMSCPDGRDNAADQSPEVTPSSGRSVEVVSRSRGRAGTASVAGDRFAVEPLRCRSMPFPDECVLHLGQRVVRKEPRAGYKSIPLASFLTSPGAKTQEAEEGRITQVLSTGQVVVDFPSEGYVVCRPNELQALKPKPVAVLCPGESFGEIQLLFRTQRVATFHVAQGQDALLYVISQRDFRECMQQTVTKDELADRRNLLSEVPAISWLLESERAELARSASDMVTFKPNERVLQEGKQQSTPQWYVIAKGSVVTSHSSQGKLGVLRRGDHFGVRSFLSGEVEANSVDAGPEGAVCLRFDGGVIRSLPEVCLAFLDIDFDSYEQCSRQPEAPDPSQLTLVRTLGQGAFGTVLLKEEESTGRRYAVKQISKRCVRKNGMQAHIRMERNLHSMVDSDFIVRLYSSYRDDLFVHMLLEAVEGGSLKDAVGIYQRHGEVFDIDQWVSIILFYVAGIVEALEHIHERHIAHRDLKPENVLLDPEGFTKLCDFGFARFVLHKTCTFLGTPEYMAPEIIDFPHEHDHRVDWWSLGVVAFELLSGQAPWDSSLDADAGQGANCAYVIRGRQKANPFPEGVLPEGTPADAEDFVRKLLVPSKKRLGSEGAQQVRDHRWFKESGLDFEELRSQSISPPCSPGFFKGLQHRTSYAKTESETQLPGLQELNELSTYCSPYLEDMEPDRHEDDDVFQDLQENEWWRRNIQIACSTFTRTGGMYKGYDAWVVSRTATVVRITVDAGRSRGCIRFGLTSDPNDDQEFEHGYWVAVVPNLPQGRHKATSSSYLSPPGLPLTLATEDGRAEVYRQGKLVHRFGPIQKARWHAKAFIAEKGDSAEIHAFVECPDDDSGWDKVFEPSAKECRWRQG